jgi:hypothetical protein
MSETRDHSAEGVGPAPRTREELARWLLSTLDVAAPSEPMLHGHDAPLAYLAHSFFEGSGPGEAGGTGGDCLVWANRGGGKTFLAAVATALDLIFKPGVQVRILAGSLEQGQRMHAHLRRIFERPSLAALVQGRITERRLRLKNGSGVELLSQSMASVRGTRVQKIRCDEVELFDPDVWDAAQLATRSAECGGVRVPGTIEAFSTMHVPHGLMSRLVAESVRGSRRLFKWGVVDVLERCGPEHACRIDRASSPNGGASAAEAIVCPLWDECRGRAKERAESGHLSVRDAITMKGRVALPIWESEMLCLRPRRTDSVYPEFDPAIHVIDDAAPALPASRDGIEEGVGEPATLLASMDFGFRAPTAILWGELRSRGPGLTSTLVIVRERIEASIVLARHVEAIAAQPRPRWIAVDPAGHQVNDQTGVSNVQLLRDAGLEVRSRQIGIGAGVALVRARLAPADGSPPRLLIHRRCAGLIRALEQYHYDPKRPESPAPVKDDSDHAADALRYLVVCLDHAYRSTTRTY